ncbi:hypothetical protein WS86_19330 [Burkholderia savannae]|nr:hypothetical protein WS86_19330 [Burkholderia savannae]
MPSKPPSPSPSLPSPSANAKRAAAARRPERRRGAHRTRGVGRRLRSPRCFGHWHTEAAPA